MCASVEHELASGHQLTQSCVLPPQIIINANTSFTFFNFSHINFCLVCPLRLPTIVNRKPAKITACLGSFKKKKKLMNNIYLIKKIYFKENNFFLFKKILIF